ncbi:serine/threonine-protein kinase [Haloferula sp.]|uniref:serine/threonine-protein kinase n=1 Tax=Haloferula sp. TaxID=2497595 RepID=UPI003C78703C
MPPTQPDGSLGGLAVDQLLMRGLETPKPTGGDWSPPEPAELSDAIDERYEVLRLLGHGGMGAVYQARDKRLSRLVAIKILPAELVDHPGALARFEREARALAALDHPNIVKVHDYGQTSEGSPFFAMEFVRGKDIQALRDGGELDLASALKLVSQVCGALHFAHSRGVIHRDIKPANILVSDEGVAKVADFGLAKVMGTESRPQDGGGLTLSGEVMGTPSYMAPEQENGRPVDHRTDIYALGVMLYSLLTGSPPRGAWTLPSKKFNIDVRLDEIVLRALQDDPELRYQAADEFKSDIDSVSEQSGGSALPPGVEAPPLPSTTGGHVPESSHFHSSQESRQRVAVSTQKPQEDEFLATTRSLSTTMLVLGLLAIGVMGGLAIFLANRKTGDTTHLEQTITTSETRNTFFTQLISRGVATENELAAIEAIRPYGDGLIGYSREILTGEQAEQLAESTGGEVLSITTDPQESTTPMITWILEELLPLPANPMWVKRDGELQILDGNQAGPPESGAKYKALIRWGLSVADEPAEPSNSAAIDEIPDIQQQVEPPPPVVEQKEEVVQPSPVAQPEVPKLHQWTDLKGRTIEAKFLRTEGEAVVIWLREKEFTIPFSNLTPESAALAKELHKTKTEQ